MPTYKFNRALVEAVNLNDFRRFNVCHYFNDVFHSHPGEEHYKLLSYISSLFADIRILDIGTSVGCSAMAFASNSENQVTTYDVTSESRSNIKMDNLLYKIGDVMEEDFTKYSVIFCDANKDGTFEQKLIDKLNELNWIGWVIFDGTVHYDHLRPILKTAKGEIHDVTFLGHWSGTALVNYGMGEIAVYNMVDDVFASVEEIPEEPALEQSEKMISQMDEPAHEVITVVNLGKRFKFN